MVVDFQDGVNEESGEVERQPRSDEEIERLTQLIKDAIGFDVDRGDSVSVVSVAFQSEPVIHRLVGGRLGARVRQIACRHDPWIAGPVCCHSAIDESAHQWQHAFKCRCNAGQRALGGTGQQGEGIDYQSDVALAQRLAASDPRLAAQVLKKWIDDSNGR